MRTILHSDLNNYYASVECLKNPDIKAKPVVVVGDRKDRQGIVLAKNQIAKASRRSTYLIAMILLAAIDFAPIIAPVLEILNAILWPAIAIVGGVGTIYCVILCVKLRK